MHRIIRDKCVENEKRGEQKERERRPTGAALFFHFSQAKNYQLHPALRFHGVEHKAHAVLTKTPDLL